MRSSTVNAVIAFALCLGAGIGYWMWYVVIEAKSATVADLQNQIDAKNETATRTALARATLSQIAGDEVAVQSYFVPETGVVAFIDSLQARGTLQKAVVNVLSVSKDDTSARPTLAFTISVTGTFDAVMRTVGSIEYAPYDLSISDLSINQDSKNAWNANAKLLVGSIVPAATVSTTTP